jgi:hypothetical protein
VKKSLVVVALAAAAALVGYKKMKDEQAEQDLWAEATDPVR